MSNTAVAYDRLAAERLTDRLGGTWNGVKGKALCPYHDDHHPSLDIKAGDTRDIIAYCQVCGNVFERLVADGHVERSSSLIEPATPTRPKVDAAREEYLRKRDALLILRAALGEQPSAYLAARGIDYCPPQAGIVPIHMAKELLSIRSDREGKRVLPKNAPVMTFPIISKGKLQGAHTTVLNIAGTGKLNDNARRVHGVKKGGFIPLWEDELNPDAPLLVGEGVETTLSAMVLSGYQGVSAVDAGNCASVCLPPCREIIILQDRDEAGRKAVESLIARYGATKTIRVAVPPKGCKDWNDALQSDLDREDLKRRIVEAEVREREEESESDGVVHALTMEQFMHLDFPPQEFLMKPWLATSSLNMVHAQRGHLKTLFTLSVAYCVATGRPLMGWACEKQCRVLYIDGELGGDLLKRRLSMLGPYSPNLLVLSDSMFRQKGQAMPKLDDDAGQEFFDDVIEKNNIDLVIPDSLSTLASPEIEKDPTAWVPVQAWALKHRSRGRSIIFVHHDSRGHKPRGHSKKEDILDTMIQLKLKDEQPNEDETALELHFPKSRGFFGADAASMVVRLSTKSGTAEWVAESMRDNTRNRVAELLDEGWKQNEIAKELDVTEGRVSQLVKEIKEERIKKRGP
jgi:putative DNA primase/helicase